MRWKSQVGSSSSPSRSWVLWRISTSISQRHGISGAGGDSKCCGSLPMNGFDPPPGLLKSDAAMGFCRGRLKMPNIIEKSL